ncbi:MAG TPA: hypothetical protein VK169_15230 [Saprospiraceae bacterium]|nr:hypothetical protein [Saprospiraceae bacterium]
MEKRKRKRIPIPRKFKAGDVLWADGNNGHHLTIILQDHTIDNHQECIPICNFTGTPPPDWLHYSISLGSFNLPSEWWTQKGQQKPENWIICNPKDCIKATSHDPNHVIGNIKNDYLELYTILCETTRQCLVAKRLEQLCDCENNTKLIPTDDSSCKCENIPPYPNSECKW